MTNDKIKRVCLTSGIVLGLSIVAWIFVMTLTGWYRDPTWLHLFWAALALQCAIIVGTLYRMRHGRDFRAQLGAGLSISGVAAVLVFVGSLLITGVFFPRYFDELHAAQRDELLSRGIAKAEVDKTLGDAAPSRSPGSHAFAGLMGTLGTGFVLSLVAAALFRERRGGDTL